MDHGPPRVGPLLWIDVEDLLDHARHFRQPSGIQRVMIEVGRALRDADPTGAAVRFCRHASLGSGFATIEWSAVEAALATPEPERPVPSRPVGARRSWFRSWLRDRLARLPPATRDETIRLFRGLREAALAAVALGRLATRRAATPQPGAPADRSGDAQDFAAHARRGDVLLSMGAAWLDPHFARRLEWAQDSLGLRYAMLLHDLIPLVRPEWVHPTAVADFRRWWEHALPRADTVLAISRATAADVARTAASAGLSLQAPVRTIPLGSGFGPPAAATEARPVEGDYVLFVSTLDARKNHALLLRVWRRLLDEGPAERVPTLVFAGRVGWMMGDLLQQLENAGFYGGKVRLIADPSDAVVAALYRDCRFTLYPSLYEGWGLPVSESFAFGKACLCADRTSLPEAGGALAGYFDPESVDSCHAAVVAWLRDPAALQAAEARVRREFVPMPWSATAAALRRELGLVPVSAPAHSLSASPAVH